jgi:hypothetical protein
MLSRKAGLHNWTNIFEEKRWHEDAETAHA